MTTVGGGSQSPFDELLLLTITDFITFGPVVSYFPFEVIGRSHRQYILANDFKWGRVT